MRVHDLAVGQVGEWLVWSHLVATSDGDLHVFLPLEDRGIDGIIHRISTDSYARVQVKERDWHRSHGIVVGVRAEELADDQATLVAVHLDLEGVALGRTVLVIPVPEFRRLAHRYEMADGAILYEAEVLLPPRADSIWHPWCCDIAEMGERLLPGAATGAILAAPLAPTPAPAQDAAKRLGARAEMELLRRATDCDALNVFKAHPDLEPNEYVMYNTQTRTVRGVQVKAVSLQAGASEADVSVYRPALRPSATTWFVVLLADAGSSDFLPECAVIPSDVVLGVLRDSSRGHGNEGRFEVTRGVTGRLAEWRVPLASLGDRLSSLPLRPES
jgi:hypothetical protein